jgi:farnesyl-diphosphate farnesyltransferase
MAKTSTARKAGGQGVCHFFRMAVMDDWTYCKKILPKVSRTFALNISVLRGDLYRSILVAYLFCRIIDTIEDATQLDPESKIRRLMEFSDMLENPHRTATEIESWTKGCAEVDGTVNDLDLLANTQRVFRVFDSLKTNHQEQIIPSVTKMAQGMAYYQKRFSFGQLNPLGDLEELEEYCYFVAGLVGEMLCNLFLQELPSISEEGRATMKSTAVSFGLGLQLTNISKDIVVDRNRGWSYIPKSIIAEKGLTVEEFHAGASMDKNLEILEKLLHKTRGHLQDALRFTLAIPRQNVLIRLFCIWPLWMAMETVAVLHNNPELLNSNANVKISRSTVKRILRRTPPIAASNSLLQKSFDNILQNNILDNPPRFDLDSLKKRLDNVSLKETSSS